MKSKRSCFNATIYKKNLIHLWPLWLVYTMALLLLVPAHIMVSCSYFYSGFTAEQLQYLKTCNYVFALFRGVGHEVIPFLAILPATAIAMSVFRYLFNDRSAQAYHAMPLSRRELFFSHYLAGLTILLVPVLLAFFCGVIITVLSGITSLEYLLAWGMIYGGECFFFYSMAVLMCMFTGQLWVVAFFQLIFNVLFIGVRYIVTSLMGTIGYGLSQSYANRQTSIFSPLMFMVNRIGLKYEKYYAGSMVNYEFEIVGLDELGIYLLVAILMTVVAYVLYRRRKIEMTGDVLSIWKTWPLFRWGVAVCGAFLCGMCAFWLLESMIHTPRSGFLVVLISVMVGAVICFFAAEMMLEKRLAVFQKKRVTEGIVCCVLCGMFVISIKCNAFGLETALPDEEDIKSAGVTMFYEVNLDTPEGIAAIRQIHQDIIDSKDEFLAYQSNYGMHDDVMWTEIDYTLTDGSRMVRSYAVPVSTVYLENQDSVASEIYGLSMDPENYLRGVLDPDYESIEIKNMSICLYTNELDMDTVELSDSQSRQLYQAYIRDIRQGHILLLTGDSAREKMYYMNSIDLEYTRSQTPREMQYACLELNTQCRDTVELLEKWGIVDQDHRLLTGLEYELISDEIYGP